MTYNTGLYQALKNAPLPEQKNSILRTLEGVMAHMTQFNCLTYLRWFLAELNQEQDDTATGKCFFKRRRR